MYVLARNSCSCIHNFNFHAAVMRAGPHFQDAAGGHGVTRIQKKIQKYLLQFIGGAEHRRQSICQILYHLNLRRFQRVRHQRQCFFDHMIHVNVRNFRSAGTRKIQQIIHNFAGSERLLHNFFDNRMSWIVFRHLLGQHLNVVGNHCQRRIYFMRHTRRKQP